MLSHSQARDVLELAFEARGIKPSARELQAVQAIAHLESFYGSKANNWGSIQSNQSPPCGPNAIELTDTHADGTPYQWCYRAYPTPQAGAEDLLAQLYRRKGVPQALKDGTGLEVAQAMRATGYFEAPADRYGKGITDRARLISEALKEPFLLGNAPPAKVSSSRAGVGVAVVGVLALGLVLLYRRA